jgi:hypothetical protein
MSKRILILSSVAVLASACLWADFSYDQTTTITGGVMKSVSFLSKQLREPIRSSVALKGDRMATISSLSGHIIDLAAETITEINFQKKTYSVMTFAQMAEAMNRLQGKAKTDFTIKPSVKETGQTRDINGVSTHEIVMTLEFEGTDSKTNQRATMMVMVADMWIAPEVPGYAEVREFHQRMAQKLNWVPGGSMMGGGQESAKGMAELYKEMGKLNGVPVLQLTKMNMGGAMPQGDQIAATGTAPPPPPPPQPEVQQPQQQPVDLEKPSVSGALGRLGGRLGGLGRKKQTDQTQNQTSGSQSQGQAAGGPPSMMESTTELNGFSSASVDSSKFEVPAGFKQVESPMLKGSQSR